MLRLSPTVKHEELEKYGFKRVKDYLNLGKSDKDLFYRCFSRGNKVIYINYYAVTVEKWDPKDPRIHANANCKYRWQETAEDMIFDLTKAGMLEKWRY